MSHDLAAALLRDVPRFSLIDGPYGPFMGRATSGEYLHVSDVSSALTAALNGVDERAGDVVERLRGRPDAIEDVDRLRDEAADLITTLLAQNAALRANTVQALDEADREYSRKTNDLIERHAEQLAALRAEVRKSAMDAVSAGCQAQEAYEAQKAAEAERDALRAERDAVESALLKEAKMSLSFLSRSKSAEAKVEKLRGALKDILDTGGRFGSAAHMANVDAIARAALTTEADPAEVFNKADWFWRTMDPEDCGDTPEEAINRAMLGRFCVCEIASSYSGPTRYGFIAPVLDPESDDEEFVHFATQQEAIDAAKIRAAITKEKLND